MHYAVYIQHTLLHNIAHNINYRKTNPTIGVFKEANLLSFNL